MKSISRNIINVAYGLNHSKEMRDLFLDIVEKVIEPFKCIKLNHSDVNVFLKNYREAPQLIEPLVS